MKENLRNLLYLKKITDVTSEGIYYQQNNHKKQQQQQKLKNKGKIKK